MTTTPTLSADIAAMFAPENFRELGHKLIDLLADYLADNLAGQDPVMHWQAPEKADAQWQMPLPQEPLLDAAGLLARLKHDILPASLAIHHPHNMGHQVATPLPVAALCDLVAALTNQAMAVYETGPSATMLERQVLRWLGELIGWQDAGGILTSGGAQANLTALLAARQHAADVWKHGVADVKPLRILVSEHAHYSISRAAGIMGLGTDAVVSIPTDTEGRMLVNALAVAHAEALANDTTVMAVVATAGCTPTGSIDPLLEIGRYCQDHGLWLHVDGAHGASALLSEQHRPALEGIALADSVVWDGHKLLYMPAAVSAVLFRNTASSFEAFSQDASYLFQGGEHIEEMYNVSYRTLECTKRMMGLKLWVAFSLYGARGMAQLLDSAFAKARLLAQKLDAHADFELLMQPQTNIVCFRHRPTALEGPALDAHQSRLREQLVQSGRFHLTRVTLEGRVWLRTTLMNPYTQAEDMDELLLALNQLGQQALA
ncbi:pyridoxal phosphate-dependent decarboxylase family protein [Methylovorus glucosotrophus]|uniref:Pyridoxal-dependent decarboxylase n=1 Tax=Methylovorus glucosotrophus (strain SIP3-4) TaxID=582744 RepID=C6XAK5_METGS|nr:aminotransferase class V-fold PLP-dependent enzyme [Methylovorus glucosotrophus]ACT49937.1 Pyridoxal-dependent decarboxylase [Methylovorus glucosotrophus SIP3-4]